LATKSLAVKSLLSAVFLLELSARALLVREYILGKDKDLLGGQGEVG
jgi:hypothetical protein